MKNKIGKMISLLYYGKTILIIAMLSHCLTMFDRKEQKQKWNQIVCFIIFSMRVRVTVAGLQPNIVSCSDDFSFSDHFLSCAMSMITWKKHSALVIVIVLFFEGEHFREPNISISHSEFFIFQLNEKFTMWSTKMCEKYTAKQLLF